MAATSLTIFNNSDGGNRKFILVELNDYAESITAERVQRVGGSFDFYELGAELFDDEGFINAEIPREKLFDYVYFSETQKHFKPTAEELRKHFEIPNSEPLSISIEIQKIF